MTKAIAIKDLLIEEIQALKLTKDEIIEFFSKYKLSREITNYILQLYNITKNVSGQVIKIGKIIIMKIIEFIKTNPNLSIGIALGAIAGALASIFISWIPFVGNVLTAISIGAGMFIGAVSGYRLDLIAKGEVIVDTSIFGVFGDAMQIAKKFINLFKEIIMSLQN